MPPPYDTRGVETTCACSTAVEPTQIGPRAIDRKRMDVARLRLGRGPLVLIFCVERGALPLPPPLRRDGPVCSDVSCHRLRRRQRDASFPAAGSPWVRGRSSLTYRSDAAAAAPGAAAGSARSATGPTRGPSAVASLRCGGSICDRPSGRPSECGTPCTPRLIVVEGH